LYLSAANLIPHSVSLTLNGRLWASTWRLSDDIKPFVWTGIHHFRRPPLTFLPDIGDKLLKVSRR